MDVIGLDRRLVHDEACRWEHVMSEQVEDRLDLILRGVTADPFGNPIPPRSAEHPHPSDDEHSADRAAREGRTEAVITRIGEPIQADAALLASLEDARIVAGARIQLRRTGGGVRIVADTEETGAEEPIVLPDDVARHLFLAR